MKKKEDNKYEEEIENITEILSKIDSGKVPFEFEFFSGGKNKKFDKLMQSICLSSDNIDFLYFLQSDICKCMLIHIETGNIYYNDQDTNESVFDFFINSKIQIKESLIMIFFYSGDYVRYFDWLIHGFDSYQKTRLDVISSKNAKYLFYRYNDTLQ